MGPPTARDSPHPGEARTESVKNKEIEIRKKYILDSTRLTAIFTAFADTQDSKSETTGKCDRNKVTLDLIEFLFMSLVP